MASLVTGIGAATRVVGGIHGHTTSTLGAQAGLRHYARKGGDDNPQAPALSIKDSDVLFERRGVHLGLVRPEFLKVSNSGLRLRVEVREFVRHLLVGVDHLRFPPRVVQGEGHPDVFHQAGLPAARTTLEEDAAAVKCGAVIFSLGFYSQNGHKVAFYTLAGEKMFEMPK
eukprot:GHVT01100922.1.p1 GENE.GHVT01100922.1~~GHVT01100922.1.p1  ORF type:complete len:170 (+),score=16.61 GHVT01100922.1:202-711(+)